MNALVSVTVVIRVLGLRWLVPLHTALAHASLHDLAELAESLCFGEIPCFCVHQEWEVGWKACEKGEVEA